MTMPAYFRPVRLGEALEIRADRGVAVLAGGTDVYPARTARVGWGDLRHPDVLDISGLAELKGISESDGQLRFGALVTWSELARAALPPAFEGYKAAARQVGGLQVQNRGTLAGNVCTASPAGDGIPCLVALAAEIELSSVGRRRLVPITDFVDGYRHTVCRPDELVTAILVPKPGAAARGGFVKLGARRYLVISIVMAAGVVETDDEGMITNARIAVGACSPVARRLPELESALIGVPLADATAIVSQDHFAALQPIDDVRGSGVFRSAAVNYMVHDLLAGFGAESDRKAA